MRASSPYPMRPTARQLGLRIGRLPTGAQNDLCDVPGVLVGHASAVSGDGDLRPGMGPIRTGVTAIVPHGSNLFAEKVPAGLFVLNGFGKSVGLAQIQELGTLETPILLTNTLSVFRVADALITHMVKQNPQIGVKTGTVNPVVGECNDGFLNDIQGRHVTAEHVMSALADATSRPVEQGAVGAGTGTVCFGFKGGIGSASRLAGGWVLGALVQTNFGRREELLIGGRSVGWDLREYTGGGIESPPGSVMVVIGTNAPLESRQIERLCKRAALGLARTGGTARNGSGDFVLGFSTAVLVPHRPMAALMVREVVDENSPEWDQLITATVEAVEEAVVNSLFCAVTVQGRDRHSAPALPVDRLTW